MSTQFDHIRLSRAFRPIVLATIKANPGWPAYMTAHGYDGRSEDLTKPEIHEACASLGIDLQAMYDADVAGQAITRPLSPGVETIDEATGETVRVTFPLDDEDEDEAHMSPSEPSLEGRDIDEVIAEALAPVSVHMTPHLASLMPGVLKPIVELAVRGPRIVREVETVTVTTGGEHIAAIKPVFVPPLVKVVKTVPLYQAFGLRRSDAKADHRYALEHIEVKLCDCREAPAIDPDYVWQAEMLCDLAAQDIAGLNGWVFGPAGTGKTAGLEQYAARLGRPFFRIAFERQSEASEIIGQDVPEGGRIVWRDGKLARAFRVPHAVILLDEPTLLRSGTLAMLQTALDHRAIFTASGEVIRAADGVFVCVADNTAGNGDDTGRYVDTSPCNAAFLDRFALKTPVSWLTIGQETTMLAARARIHPVAAKIMVEYASSTRTQADAGQITMGVTPRRLIAWARAVKAGIASSKAWSSTIITGAAPEDREKLIALEAVDLRGKHDRIDGIVRGTIDPLAPVVDPKAQGGVGPTALQFPDDNEGQP